MESLEVDVDSNENKDTSNMTGATAESTTTSPKKSPTDIGEGKCFSNIMNCLPIAADSEIILVKQ